MSTTSNFLSSMKRMFVLDLLISMGISSLFFLVIFEFSMSESESESEFSDWVTFTI